jgi:hypothetical protein
MPRLLGQRRTEHTWNRTGRISKEPSRVERDGSDGIPATYSIMVDKVASVKWMLQLINAYNTRLDNELDTNRVIKITTDMKSID